MSSLKHLEKDIIEKKSTELHNKLKFLFGDNNVQQSGSYYINSKKYDTGIFDNEIKKFKDIDFFIFTHNPLHEDINHDQILKEHGYVEDQSAKEGYSWYDFKSYSRTMEGVNIKENVILVNDYTLFRSIVASTQLLININKLNKKDVNRNFRVMVFSFMENTFKNNKTTAYASNGEYTDYYISHAKQTLTIRENIDENILSRMSTSTNPDTIKRVIARKDVTKEILVDLRKRLKYDTEYTDLINQRFKEIVINENNNIIDNEIDI